MVTVDVAARGQARTAMMSTHAPVEQSAIPAERPPDA
jgi:hypothetical protein